VTWKGQSSKQSIVSPTTLVPPLLIGSSPSPSSASPAARPPMGARWRVASCSLAGARGVRPQVTASVLGPPCRRLECYVTALGRKVWALRMLCLLNAEVDMERGDGEEEPELHIPEVGVDGSRGGPGRSKKVQHGQPASAILHVATTCHRWI
jgi:hypothetical protein